MTKKVSRLISGKGAKLVVTNAIFKMTEISQMIRATRFVLLSL